MSYTITQVNAAAGADTFQIWVNRTNESINVISTMAVTTNTHANGGLTTGNGFVEGIFGARNLVANTVRGGTVQTPGVLTLSSNLSVTGNTLTLGTVVINSTSISVAGEVLYTGRSPISTNTSGTTTQQIDFFDKITVRAADYFISIKDNNANAYQASRFSCIHNSGDAYYTQYAVVFSNTAQGDFSANANATHVRVYLTPTSTNTHVSGTRIIVEV